MNALEHAQFGKNCEKRQEGMSKLTRKRSVLQVRYEDFSP